MPEEKKEKVLKILKEFPEEKFNIKQINSMIDDISYPTLLKWVMVLEAEGKIRVEDYGNVKLIQLNKEYYKDGRNKD